MLLAPSESDLLPGRNSWSWMFPLSPRTDQRLVEDTTFAEVATVAGFPGIDASSALAVPWKVERSSGQAPGSHPLGLEVGLS